MFFHFVFRLCSFVSRETIWRKSIFVFRRNFPNKKPRNAYVFAVSINCAKIFRLCSFVTGCACIRDCKKLTLSTVSNHVKQFGILKLELRQCLLQLLREMGEGVAGGGDFLRGSGLLLIVTSWYRIYCLYGIITQDNQGVNQKTGQNQDSGRKNRFPGELSLGTTE